MSLALAPVPAQELALDEARAPAGLRRVGHELLVHVEVDADVQRHLVVRHAEAGHLVRAVLRARGRAWEWVGEEKREGGLG